MPLSKKLKKLALTGVFGAATLGIGAAAYHVGEQRAAAPVHAAMTGEVAEQGDGHPVLVIPGFMTNDMYMSSLKESIAQQGYVAYGWAGGLNMGLDVDEAARLEERLSQIYAENGNQKVSLVGYSLGGVYARELARKHPDMVRDVITLSSPFGLDDERVTGIYAHFHGEAQNAHQAMLLPPPVPTLAVYSKNDRFVDWQTSINPPSSGARNAEVSSGHIALPFSGEALDIIAGELARGGAAVNISARNTPRPQGPQ